MRKRLENPVKIMSISRFIGYLFLSIALFVAVTPAAAERSEKVKRALNLIEFGASDDAIAVAQSAIGDNGKDHEAWAVLGIAYIAEGNMTEAEKAVGRAFELERKNGLVRIARGKFFGKQGKISDALDEFRLALKYDQNDLDAYL